MSRGHVVMQCVFTTADVPNVVLRLVIVAPFAAVISLLGAQLHSDLKSQRKKKRSVSPPEICVNVPPSSPASHIAWGKHNVLRFVACGGVRGDGGGWGDGRRGQLASHYLERSPVSPTPTTGKRGPVCVVVLFARNNGPCFLMRWWVFVFPGATENRTA